MDKALYKIIFEGKILEGQNPDKVKGRLASLFKTKPSSIEKLFTCNQVVIKSGVNATVAANYRAAFQKAGAHCKIVKFAPPKEKATSGKKLTHKKKESPPKAEPELTTEQILDHFKGDIEPVRISFLYRVGLALVSVVMILLPILYGGFILFTGYGLFYHATENFSVFQTITRPQIALIIYIAPLFIGIMLIAFMIKPFFVKFLSTGDPVALSLFKEERLYEFVRKICKAVHAPMPQRIFVDCHVNASAGFNKGIMSLFENDLVLTIGLPLVLGLNTRQLAGVLAHEFGHFSQGTGMRLTYIIREINFWLAQIVYSRDIWDQRLDIWTSRADWRIQIILYSTRFFIWLTRRFMWVFMWIGNLVSCFMLRQMEFDADRYEAHLAGSDQFAGTSKQIQIMNVGYEQAFDDLKETWNDEQLAEDLPGLILKNTGQLPSEVESKIQSFMEQGRTGFFDTHPCDRVRIGSVMKENAPGIFNLEIPSQKLFQDISRLSKKATLVHYQNEFGLALKDKNLISVQAISEQKEDLEASHEIMDRYCFGLFSVIRPLPIQGKLKGGIKKPKVIINEIIKIKDQLKNNRQQALLFSKGFHRALDRVTEVWEAQILLQADIFIDKKSFHLSGDTEDVVEKALDKALTEKSSSGMKLSEIEENLALRFDLVLSLLDFPEVTERIPDGQELKPESKRLLKAFHPFSFSFERLDELHQAYISLYSLVNNYQNNMDNQKLIDGIENMRKKCRKYLFELYYNLKNISYPFPHAQGSISVASYVFGEAVQAEDVQSVLIVCETAMEKIFSLHVRLMARLSVIAETVEAEALSVTTTAAVETDPPAGK